MTTSSRGEPLLAAPSAMGAPSVRFLVLVIVLSLSFFLNFVAFNAAQSLDGSLPAPPGVASTQFMVIYITFGVLCIPAPKLISFIGPKAAIILGMATYVGVTASFLAPPMCTSGTAASAPCWSAQSIWTLRMLTAALLGLGAPILWTGQGVYLGRLAAHEASRLLRADQAPPEKAAQVRGRVLKRFNGIFWTAFQASGAVGLVGASLVLVLVRSSHATFYLFLGLSACSIGGLACVVTLLPRLPPADEPAALGVAEEATAEAGDDGTGAADGPPPVTILATLRLCADARMLLLVPNIVYNGMSLAFMWYLYNTFVFSTALGTSFVGFGAAFGFFISAIATTASSRVAARFGQLPTMTGATLAQLAFFLLLQWYRVQPARCLPSGCAQGTAGACWRVGNASTTSTGSFPTDCVARGVPCAECAAYRANHGQTCAAAGGWEQCEWLHGTAESPRPADVAVMLLAMGVFYLGDAVWECQVPTVLQTLFDQRSGAQPAAMANLKLWQSLGIGLMFGLAQLSNLRLSAALLLGLLVLSSAALLVAHIAIVDFDTGERRRRRDSGMQ